MNIADTLDAAADILVERGHCKSALTDGEGRHCALGAILATETWGADQCLVAVYDYLGLEKYPSLKGYGIVNWNNAEEREGWEVVNAFRHTAKSLRGGAE